MGSSFLCIFHAANVMEAIDRINILELKFMALCPHKSMDGDGDADFAKIYGFLKITLQLS